MEFNFFTAKLCLFWFPNGNGAFLVFTFSCCHAVPKGLSPFISSLKTGHWLPFPLARPKTSSLLYNGDKHFPKLCVASVKSYVEVVTTNKQNLPAVAMMIPSWLAKIILPSGQIENH